uniref:NADH-ubiquinone oxidoreductase chain 5 n=1 Tax=Diolcogaster sp. SNS-2016 TaxID=1911508 RepID=A0A6F8A7T2_9HYME|nr:NADH dehydrogenase subunit 5 [Diolcogaster sp. SNS-2016]
MIFFIMSFFFFLMSLMYFNLSVIFLIYKLNYFYEFFIYMSNFLLIKFVCYNDWLSNMFIATIFLISSMVILYSIEYMNKDLNINRFMMLIILFVFSMIFMILSMNLMTILLGWDGLGLSSYCLVIYYQNKKSYNSGMITMLMNRLGDIFILISISMMLSIGSWNFIFLNKFYNNLLLFMIFMASMTKSAQIPFSTWLPLAMAAPTPISSLVHSSTLVTAGVYLMIRFNTLISINIMNFIMILSSFTMFLSGVSANFEFDLKKIIALSTLSQLGLMFFIYSFNLPILTFFHLITHAMFKSLLFLCSGIIIHNYSNNQDIRLISLNNYYMPLINMIFIISSLTLCGMPFLSGFYSKDLIIEMFNMKFNNFFFFLIMYLSMGLTVSYSFRLIYYLNFKFFKMMIYFNIYLNNYFYYSIMILVFLKMFLGSMMNWLIFNSMNFIYLSMKLKLMIYLLLIKGMFLGMFINKLNYFKFKFLKKNFIFFNLMFYLPKNFMKIKINYFKFSKMILLMNDYGWNEYIYFKKLIFMFNYYKFNLLNVNLFKIFFK